VYSARVSLQREVMLSIVHESRPVSSWYSEASRIFLRSLIFFANGSDEMYSIVNAAFMRVGIPSFPVIRKKSECSGLVPSYLRVCSIGAKLAEVLLEFEILGGSLIATALLRDDLRAIRVVTSCFMGELEVLYLLGAGSAGDLLDGCVFVPWKEWVGVEEEVMVEYVSAVVSDMTSVVWSSCRGMVLVGDESVSTSDELSWGGGLGLMVFVASGGIVGDGEITSLLGGFCGVIRVLGLGGL
jgi:hypothetical protein